MNLAGYYPESTSNGEGWRAVIFVSGCPHKCPGCQNEKAQDFKYGHPFTFEEQFKIYEDIKENEGLAGVTLSGGEPFESAKGLIPLVSSIKQLGKDVWTYTGYTLEELLSSEDGFKLNLLYLTDVLIDGRFEENKKDVSLFFRGSSNQRIIDMNRYRETGSIEDSLKNYEGENLG